MKEEYSVTIKGTKAYLMHAFKGDLGKSARRGAHPTFEEDCKDALYTDDSGEICVPSLQVWASIRDGSKVFKFKGRQSFWQVVNSSVFVEPELIPLSPQTYTPFITGVVIQRQRIMKARPKFSDWDLRFRIVNTDEVLTQEKLRDIVDEAGLRHGIGDWRPRFGTYEVVEWKKVGGEVQVPQ